ncbi:MAG: ATP-binding protein [Desulfovibrionaceae bacterium]
MADYTFRADDMRPGELRPLAEVMILLKNLIGNDSTLYELDLAVTEACANVARHAYDKGEACPVEVRVRVHQGVEVEVLVTDWGRGIPEQHMQAGLPEDDAESGRGIPLMTDLCDRVSFHKQGDRNTVTLLKRVPARHWRE